MVGSAMKNVHVRIELISFVPIEAMFNLFCRRLMNSGEMPGVGQKQQQQQNHTLPQIWGPSPCLRESDLNGWEPGSPSQWAIGRGILHKHINVLFWVYFLKFHFTYHHSYPSHLSSCLSFASLSAHLPHIFSMGKDSDTESTKSGTLSLDSTKSVPCSKAKHGIPP